MSRIPVINVARMAGSRAHKRRRIRSSAATLAGFACIAQLSGCNKLTPADASQTMALLRAGSEKVCVASEVQKVLRDQILPKVSDLEAGGATEDRAAAAQAITISYDMTTLQGFDKDVAKATCNSTITVANNQGEAQSFEVDYHIAPSAEMPGSFIVNGRTQAATAYARLLANVLVARTAEARQNEIDETATREAEGKLLALVNE